MPPRSAKVSGRHMTGSPHTSPHSGKRSSNPSPTTPTGRSPMCCHTSAVRPKSSRSSWTPDSQGPRRPASRHSLRFGTPGTQRAPKIKPETASTPTNDSSPVWKSSTRRRWSPSGSRSSAWNARWRVYFACGSRSTHFTRGTSSSCPTQQQRSMLTPLPCSSTVPVRWSSGSESQQSDLRRSP